MNTKAYMLILKIDVYKQNILKSFGDNHLKVILLLETNKQNGCTKEEKIKE